MLKATKHSCYYYPDKMTRIKELKYQKTNTSLFSTVKNPSNYLSYNEMLQYVSGCQWLCHFPFLSSLQNFADPVKLSLSEVNQKELKLCNTHMNLNMVITAKLSLVSATTDLVARWILYFGCPKVEQRSNTTHVLPSRGCGLYHSKEAAKDTFLRNTISFWNWKYASDFYFDANSAVNK